MIKLRKFASASSNIVLRTTAIQNAPDHNDPYYGKNQGAGDVPTEVANDITKPAVESGEIESPLKVEAEEAAKVSKTDIESLEELGLHLTPTKENEDIVDPKIAKDDSVGGDAELIGLGF